jgi:transcriptional regulator with XRE-family HTH domain
VPGLRREEVALLAGVSTEYYVRLERGNATGVSESVLKNISRALNLDAAEHAHCYDLVRAGSKGAGPCRRRKPTRVTRVRPGLQQTTDAMADMPVVIQDGRLDLVATNRLAPTLLCDVRTAAGSCKLRTLQLSRPAISHGDRRLMGRGPAGSRAVASRSRSRPFDAHSAIW